MGNLIFWGKCFGRPKKNLNIGQPKTFNFVGTLKFNMTKQPNNNVNFIIWQSVLGKKNELDKIIMTKFIRQ